MFGITLFFKHFLLNSNSILLSPAQIFRLNVFTNFCLTLGFFLVNILSFHLNEMIIITKAKVDQACLTLCNLMDYTVHGILQVRILEWPFPSPGDLPNPEIEARSPALRADSLPAELQGKPKNTGVGVLSLLQRIFPTQKSNLALLNCRRIKGWLFSSSTEELFENFIIKLTILQEVGED